MGFHNDPEPSTPAIAFGTEIREQCFSFAEGYHPLNHGSFGAFPKEVRNHQRRLQDASEARPDTFTRYTYLKLLRESKAAIAPLLGAEPDEVVFVQNATTGVNTVLRNLDFRPGDTVLHFNTIYGACLKTIQSLSEECPVSSHAIDITYPIDDDEILRRFRCAVKEIECRQKTPKLAIFDTVLTFPGVRFPFERLVATCKELKILSFIDGAHGVGHIDLSHLGGVVKPDFFISNCYKWLMVPRGCAVLYVPYRNQEKIASTVPTSCGYEIKAERDKLESRHYFSKLFDKISTTDNTPYCCIPTVLEFRSRVCGGEAKIREYCEYIARLGGDSMAEILGTEVLGASSASFRSCCFVNVRLPLTLAELDAYASAGRGIAKWMQELMPAEYETYIPIKFYAGGFWCRISGQVYLTLDDFEWAAQTLLDVCTRAKTGEWR
ncbi:pyridoxal phosphate-dependent transferase [Colletotrichum godetiae]|uniref:Pyridoxal phosphate-dependent transferase n=1 Tax=Colletotrichum godetiae TaxID=1209918 RepID=A0AAJ0AZC8_9PEZI|nr:pyridoxal phosphate-dependent transferase [Colletotrichum godetiae]KAK1701078.1 pyridoxal phosphate-dependent transferase [Colletotrichum godetiae]